MSLSSDPSAATAADGSEDSEINIEGLTNYTINEDPEDNTDEYTDDDDDNDPFVTMTNTFYINFMT